MNSLSPLPLFVALVLLVACKTTETQSVAPQAPLQTTENEAKKAREARRNKPLPAPTMSPAEVRQVIQDIRARQRRGEARQALVDYQERARATRTLEALYLAAAAVPDEDARWKAFKALSNDEPRFYWPHAGMASIYARWKIRDQAEKELAEAERLLPGTAWTETIRGHLNRNLGAHELARDAYRRALAIDPTDSDARTGLALAHQTMNETDAFETELLRALSDAPTHYEAAEALALWYDAANERRQALEAWERVSELAPRNRDAQLALARLRNNDPRGAARAYEAAAKIKPLDLNEEQALSKLYRELGESENEIQSLTTLARLAPTDPAPLRRLAELQVESKNTAALEKTYRNLLSLDADDIPALMGLANLTESNSRILETFAYLSRAKRAGSVAASSEFERLREGCLLPSPPITAPNLSIYYRRLAESLEKLYLARRMSSVGVLKVRITSDGRGGVTEAEIVDDTLEDPWLEAHLIVAARESTLPRLSAGQTRFVLDFDLPPVKK